MRSRAAIVILVPPMAVLVGAAVVVSLPDIIKQSIPNSGAHGFSEMLYAYTSMGNNNGSAFAGLNVNTPFYNVTGGLAMLISRFWLAIATLALAGALARSACQSGLPGRCALQDSSSCAPRRRLGFSADSGLCGTSAM